MAGAMECLGDIVWEETMQMAHLEKPSVNPFLAAEKPEALKLRVRHLLKALDDDRHLKEFFWRKIMNHHPYMSTYFGTHSLQYRFEEQRKEIRLKSAVKKLKEQILERKRLTREGESQKDGDKKPEGALNLANENKEPITKAHESLVERLTRRGNKRVQQEEPEADSKKRAAETASSSGSVENSKRRVKQKNNRGENYARELKILEDMGFTHHLSNVTALDMTKGLLADTILLLSSGKPSV